jgi:methylated-DNA-[protein]-cysteine S-methyltransferase
MKRNHRTATAAQAARILDSPVGPLYLAATDAGLTHLLFVAKMQPRPRVVAGTGEAAHVLAEAERQLSDYFAGRRRRFDLPLAPSGTDFQMATWRALRKVPFGKTISYGELARRLGSPRAVRAIGAANGANPIAIIVPCHRVIGKDGSLTGYGGGLETKRRLLALEGIRRPENEQARNRRLPLQSPPL